MTQRTCSIDGCPRPSHCRTWCNAHYQQWRKYGDPLARAPKPPTVCSFPNCDRPYDSRGYCASHARQLREGRELHPLRASRAPTCTIDGCDGAHQALGLCNKHHLRLRIHGDPEYTRHPGDAPRKYTLNQGFFDEVTTEAQAYWLGFVTADGCVSQTKKNNALIVGLHASDRDHLVQMSADLGSNRPLWSSPTRPVVTATFHSIRLVEALGRLGIGPRKSITVEPWHGPNNLMRHYWRGMFDGDGSIYKVGRGLNWGLMMCGSRFCVEAFADWAREVCSSTGAVHHLKGGCWGWRVGGTRKPRLLAEALYEGASVALPRKRERAEQLLATSNHSLSIT